MQGIPVCCVDSCRPLLYDGLASARAGKDRGNCAIEELYCWMILTGSKGRLSVHKPHEHPGGRRALWAGGILAAARHDLRCQPRRGCAVLKEGHGWRRRVFWSRTWRRKGREREAAVSQPHGEGAVVEDACSRDQSGATPYDPVHLHCVCTCTGRGWIRSP